MTDIVTVEQFAHGDDVSGLVGAQQVDGMTIGTDAVAADCPARLVGRHGRQGLLSQLSDELITERKGLLLEVLLLESLLLQGLLLQGLLLEIHTGEIILVRK